MQLTVYFISVVAIEDAIDSAAASETPPPVDSSTHPPVAPFQVNDTELTMTSVSTGSSDEEPHFGVKEPPAASNVVVPRQPRNDSRPGAFHEDGRNARDVYDDSGTAVQSDQSEEPDLDVMRKQWIQTKLDESSSESWRNGRGMLPLQRL